MKLYAVKDVKVGFMSPIMRKNDELAKRDFLNQARSSEPNMLNTNPEDYELWRIADYNEDTGIVTSNLECIATLTDERDG